MGTINSFPITTRKTSDFTEAVVVGGEIIMWSGVVGENLQRITISNVADQLLTHAEPNVETLAADKTIAAGDKFFQLLDTGGAARTVDAAAGVSALVNNQGAENIVIGASTLLPGESALVLYNGVDHEVVKLASSSGGTTFLEVTLTDVDDATAYYYGGLTAEGDWQVNKYLKSDLATKTTATEQNNITVTSLADAWTARTTLTYG